MEVAVTLKNPAWEFFQKNPNFLGVGAVRGEYALAVKDFTRVIELIPDNANAYSKRGFAFLHMKDWENAKTDLITAGDIVLNIIALFRQEFGSIADFEQKTGIQLPSDIAALLTPP